MDPTTELLLAVLATLAGAVAAIAGFGIGSLLTPALAALVGTKAAVAAVAIPHAVATLVRLWALRDAIDRRVLATFGLASAAGGLLGALLHAAVSSPVLAIALGILLVFAGALELTGIRRRLRFEGRASIAAGLASGLFGGLVGNQGGIRAAALLGFDLPARVLVATATASAALVDAARLPVYVIADGAEMVRLVPTIVALTIGAAIGTLAGAPLLRRIPEPAFRKVLGVLLVALGGALIAGVGR